MKNERKKRRYALAAALVGALALPLCSCAGGIEGKAQRRVYNYLKMIK